MPVPVPYKPEYGGFTNKPTTSGLESVLGGLFTPAELAALREKSLSSAEEKKQKPVLPSRSIYQYTPEQLGSKIDEVAQNLLGRAINETDKAAEWYKDLNATLSKMAMKGTVSTTSQVKNPKTGKLENVTIQKPEVTTEAITQKITGALEAADPISVQRKQNLDVEKWFLSMMSKGQASG